MLSTVNRKDLGAQAWDAFVDASDEAWLWHRYDLQDAISTWYGKSDLSFAVTDSDLGGAVGFTAQVIALVPLQLISGRAMGFFPWKTLDSLAAPAFINALPPRHKQKCWDFIHNEMVKTAQCHHAAQIDVMIPPAAPAFRGERCPRVNPLLSAGFDNTLTQTWMVDLRQPIEDIRSAYSELTRRELKKIRQASNSVPFEIREAAGEADLQLYYDLHCETYQRTGKRPHPIAYFRTIFECFIPKGHSRILFLTQEGKVTAAQNTGIDKGGAAYWTGASRSDKSGGENRVLFDDQIAYAKSSGCEWYDVGEAFPNVSAGKQKGLNDFKGSFGSILHPLYRGRIILRNNIVAAYHLLNSLQGKA